MKTKIKATINGEISKRELKNMEIARRVASEGIVLLKNEGVLPLKSKKLALFGNGARMTVKGGTGSGEVRERYSVSIEEGLENAGFTITTKRYMDDFDRLHDLEYKKWDEQLQRITKKWDQSRLSKQLRHILFIFLSVEKSRNRILWNPILILPFM